MSKLSFLKTNVGISILVVVALLTGFFGGTEYKAYQIRSAIAEATQTIMNTTPTNNTLNQSNAAISDDNSLIGELKKTKNSTLNEKSIGDTIELATLSVKPTKAEESNMTNDGTPIVAQQGTKFVFVTLNVTNLTKLSLSYPMGFPVIVDDQDRTYEPYDQSIGHVKNYLDVRQLSPGIPEEGVLAYQLPSTAEHYYLLMAKGGTEDFYKVQLK